MRRHHRVFSTAQAPYFRAALRPRFQHRRLVYSTCSKRVWIFGGKSRAKLERSELVKSPLRENDRVAKRIFSCPIVKRNFNPSHQGAALPSALSLEFILEILSRRYFGGTNSEDFQFVALSRFRSVAFEGFTASFRFHTIFIYRALSNRAISLSSSPLLGIDPLTS